MKILYLNTWMHPKNHNSLMNYKNIQFKIIYSIHEINNLNLSEFDIIYSPSIPIDVSLYPNIKFIFGPHFSVFPEIKQINLINNKNTIYIQPSEWVVKIWKNNIICNNLRIESLPFGVDTNKFNEIKNINERNNIFIYYKDRNPKELIFIENFLNKLNINYKLFSYKNKYNENDYLNYLHNSKYGIWIGCHESQGFALEEALSCNVPLLVWNVTSMNQEYGCNYADIFATTIPYWNEICGEFFYNTTDFEEKFNLFYQKLETYNPREYIIQNLSLEICEKKLINLINT